MISLHIDGLDAQTILAELKKLAAGFTRETDDRLIARMHRGPEFDGAALVQDVERAGAVAIAAITGTDDAGRAALQSGTQIELPLGEKPKRNRRTKAQIEADNVAEQAAIIAGQPKEIVTETIVQTTQPAVVDNTGSAQPLPLPGAEGAGAGEIDDTVRGTPSTVEPISPEAFRAKLQDAFTTEDGLRHLGALVAEFGYQRIKDIKQEHFAPIMAKADQLIADRAAA